MKNLWVGQKQVSLKPMHKVLSMTLTFDLATWSLFATYPLVMMIICAKLFINPTMHDKVMGQHKQVAKSLRADCVVVLLFYIHGKHLRSCRDGKLT